MQRVGHHQSGGRGGAIIFFRYRSKLAGFISEGQEDVCVCDKPRTLITVWGTAGREAVFNFSLGEHRFRAV